MECGGYLLVHLEVKKQDLFWGEKDAMSNHYLVPGRSSSEILHRFIQGDGSWSSLARRRHHAKWPRQCWLPNSRVKLWWRMTTGAPRHRMKTLHELPALLWCLGLLETLFLSFVQFSGPVLLPCLKLLACGWPLMPVGSEAEHDGCNRRPGARDAWLWNRV